MYLLNALKGIREGNVYDDQESRGSEQNIFTRYVVHLKGLCTERL